MHILVIHSDDEEQRSFVTHLKRIGCQVDIIWPPSETLSEHFDVVLFLLGKNRDQNPASWMPSAHDIVPTAITSFAMTEFLREIERMHVRGVLSKPIRLLGVLTALMTAIGLVWPSLARHETTLKARVRSLDQTLKACRTIERAVGMLSEARGIKEQDAYKRLREKSQNSQTSIGEIAEAITAAHDV